MSFGRHTEAMAEEKRLWHEALRRPIWSQDRVEACLQQALLARRLSTWTLEEWGCPSDVWAAWDPWSSWDDYDAAAISRGWLGAARHQSTVAMLTEMGWSPGALDYTSDPLDAWPEVCSWAPDVSLGQVKRNWARLEMRDALMFTLAVRMGWIVDDQHKLTEGLREAYRHGLGVALPVGPKVLGWAMHKGSVS